MFSRFPATEESVRNHSSHYSEAAMNAQKRYSGTAIAALISIALIVTVINSGKSYAQSKNEGPQSGQSHVKHVTGDQPTSASGTTRQGTRAVDTPGVHLSPATLSPGSQSKPATHRMLPASSIPPAGNSQSPVERSIPKVQTTTTVQAKTDPATHTTQAASGATTQSPKVPSPAPDSPAPRR